MRILYLTDNRSVHNRRFLEKLVESGHEVWAWNLASGGREEGGVPAGVRVVVSEKRVASGAGPEEFRELLPQMRAVVDEVRPEVVHAGPVQSGGYLAAAAEVHPMLLMSWGSDVLVYPGRGAEWKRATEVAMRGADGFFCDCDAVRREANRYRVFEDSQVVQFPWGVKNGVFAPAGKLPDEKVFRRKAGSTTFIYTRSWEPLYGTDVLLEGFRLAHQKNSASHLLLVGNGSQSASVREFVERSGLNGAVSSVGEQPVADLPMWFQTADVYVSCVKSDGTSISLLEAMATGLPVIVTDLPANREWVTEPENGYLAAAGSPEAVAEKMLIAAKLTAQERKAVSERNQRVVAERADWDNNFPRLLAMYERLVRA